MKVKEIPVGKFFKNKTSASVFFKLVNKVVLVNARCPGLEYSFDDFSSDDYEIVDATFTTPKVTFMQLKAGDKFRFVDDNSCIKLTKIFIGRKTGYLYDGHQVIFIGRKTGYLYDGHQVEEYDLDTEVFLAENQK